MVRRKKITTFLFLILLVAFSMSNVAFASINETYNNYSEDGYKTYVEEIDVPQVYGFDPPNYVRFSLDPLTTTDELIGIKITNVGVDAIDFISVEVSVDGKIYNLPNKMTVRPGTSSGIQLKAYQKKCHEQIICNATVIGGYVTKKGSFGGKRNLGSKYISQWSDGGRGSSENNIDYHFAKHQNDQYIRALTIADYCEGARVTLQNVIRNKAPGKSIPGATADTFKYRDGNKYIMAVGTKSLAKGPIVSYMGG